LNVLRLTEPRSAVTEIDLSNTPLGEGGKKRKGRKIAAAELSTP
jgi:hypothetical protein